MRHAESHMHHCAALVEAEHSAGGIRQAFQDAVTLEVKVAIGCCKCIYFLCKQEIAHMTTYPHQLILAERLGCEYCIVGNFHIVQIFVCVCCVRK